MSTLRGQLTWMSPQIKLNNLSKITDKFLQKFPSDLNTVDCKLTNFRCDISISCSVKNSQSWPESYDFRPNGFFPWNNHRIFSLNIGQWYGNEAFQTWRRRADRHVGSLSVHFECSRDSFVPLRSNDLSLHRFPYLPHLPDKYSWSWISKKKVHHFSAMIVRMASCQVWIRNRIQFPSNYSAQCRQKIPFPHHRDVIRALKVFQLFLFFHNVAPLLVHLF